MAQNASGFAVVESSVHFVKSAEPGDILICKAKPIKQGNIVQIWDAEIFIEGKEDSLGSIACVRSTAVNTYPSASKSNSSSVSAENEALNQNWARLGTNFNIGKMTKAEIAARFDKHSDNWEILVQKSKYEPVFQWIFDSCQDFPNRPSARVLDLACGVGLIGKTLRKSGFKGSFTASDISPRMLENAIATGFYDSLSFVHDLDNPLPSKFKSCFNLVVCTGATEMLKDPGQLLKNVSEALTPAGQFWVTFQDSTAVDAEKEHPTAHQGMKVYSLEQIRQFAALAGLKEISPPTITKAAYYLPSAKGDGRLRPVPFSMWRFSK
jgi:predicted TPR repeat methyltransferase